MKKATDVHPLLKRMARIARMERGTLCRLAGRPHYNHQTWRDGRNVSRYVRPEDAAALREAIEGYRRFMALVQQYADVAIRRTRAEQARTAAETKSSSPHAEPRPHKRPRHEPIKDV